jgi:hypothetical protein
MVRPPQAAESKRRQNGQHILHIFIEQKYFVYPRSKLFTQMKGKCCRQLECFEVHDLFKGRQLCLLASGCQAA